MNRIGNALVDFQTTRRDGVLYTISGTTRKMSFGTPGPLSAPVRKRPQAKQPCTAAIHYLPTHPLDIECFFP